MDGFQREEVRATAIQIKQQFAREFEQRFGHIKDANHYSKAVIDYLTEKLCLTAGRLRIMELEIEDLKSRL